MSAADSPSEPAPGPSEEAQETFARHLLSQRHGSPAGIDELVARHPGLERELRELDARWNRSRAGGASDAPRRSVRARLREQRGVDLDPEISLEPKASGHRLVSTADAGDASHGSSRVLARLRADGGSSRYRVEGEIGRGGMGAILRVWDEDLRRSLAMKVVLGRGEDEREVDDVKLARFLEEAQITGQLDHPGVVPVHELGLDSEGRAFFTMQLVKGRDLKQVFELVRTGTDGWSLTRALGVVLRVCEAMAFAHEKGVIHRDLKPANVMVGRFGETYVMDWGLAKVLGRSETRDVRIRRPDEVSLSIVRTDRADSGRADSGRGGDSPIQTMDGDVVGTPCYMAPEQARGELEEIGPATDVYAVGAMLYELLAGSAPYAPPHERRSPTAVLGLVLQGPPDAVEAMIASCGKPSVPGELVAICEKAMAREPRERYPDMLAMAEDLRAFLENRVVAAYEAGALAEFRKWVGRNRGMAAGLALALAAALAGLGGVAAVQARANSELSRANDQLTGARDALASTNSELGRTNDELVEASALAQAKEREAQRSSYSANLAAAAAAHAAGAVGEARRRLALCAPELRGWEWERLDLEVDSTCWSRELADRELVGPASLGTLRDLRTGADGRRVLAVTDGNLLLELDPWDGALLRERTLPGSPQRVAECPDGRLVAVDADRSLHVFRPAGDELAPLLVIERAHRSAITVLEVSPDGRRALTAAFDKHLRLHDLETGAELAELDLGTAALSAAWSPDGASFVTGGQDRNVRVHDGDSGAVRATLFGHEVPVGALAIDTTGRYLASGSRDLALASLSSERGRPGRVLVHDLESGALVHQLETEPGAEGGVASLCFLPGDTVLASTTVAGVVRLTQLASGTTRTLRSPHDPVPQSLVAGDSPMLVLVGSKGTLRGLDLSCATAVELEPHARGVVGLAVTASGELVSLSRDGLLRVGDPRSGLVLREFRGEPPLATELAVAGDRLALLAGGLGGTIGQTSLQVRLRSLVEGAPSLVIDTEEGPRGEGPRGLAISEDGSWLAVALGSGGVALHDAGSGELLRKIETEDPVTSVALAPGRRLLAVGGSWRDLGVQLVDLETDERRKLGDTGADRLVFLDGGERLAVVQAASARLFRVEDLSLQAELLGHRADIAQLAASPDGTRLATAGADGEVRIYDARSGEPLLSLGPYSVACRAVVFLPDERLVLGLDDGRVEVLHTSSETTDRTGLREAQREGRRVKFASQRFAAALLEDGLTPDEASRRVREDRGLEATVRAAALTLLARLECTEQQLVVECWDAVRTPFALPEQIELVRWRARLAVERHPELELGHKLLGMASFRLGDLRAALESLERADQLRTRRAEPEVAAFLAMTLSRLGRREEAAAQLERLRGLMGISMLRTDRDAVRLMAEAEAAVAARP